MIHIWQKVALVSLLAGVGLFSLFQLRFLLSGPYISIESYNLETNTGNVQLSFKVHNTKDLAINGMSVTPNYDGVVSYPVHVAPGLSRVGIDLQDGFGGQKREYVYITYPQQDISPDKSPG